MLACVHAVFGPGGADRFPGRLPGTFRRRDLDSPLLAHGIASPKFDGKRVLLCGLPTATYTMDRSMTVTEIDVNPWQESAWKTAATGSGILLDGEWCQDAVYYAFDVFMLPGDRDGSSVRNLPYHKRLMVLERFLANDTWKPQESKGVLTIRPKPFLCMKRVDNDPQHRLLWNDMVLCDGFVIADPNASVAFEGEEALVKLKLLITFDMQAVKDASGTWQACAGNNLRSFGRLITDFKEPLVANDVYMCKRATDGSFRVLEQLPDKKKPNAIRTVEDMLQAADEKIDLHVVLQAVKAKAAAPDGRKRKAADAKVEESDERRVRPRLEEPLRARPLLDAPWNAQAFGKVFEHLETHVWPVWIANSDVELEIRLVKPPLQAKDFLDISERAMNAINDIWQHPRDECEYLDEVRSSTDKKDQAGVLRARTYETAQNVERIGTVEYIRKTNLQTHRLVLDGGRLEMDVSLKRETPFLTEQYEEEKKKKMSKVFYRRGRRVPLLDKHGRYQLHLSQVRSGTTKDMVKDSRAPYLFEVELEAANRFRCHPVDLVGGYLSLLQPLLGSGEDPRSFSAKMRLISEKVDKT
jgi:hypothetical protein